MSNEIPKIGNTFTPTTFGEALQVSVKYLERIEQLQSVIVVLADEIDTLKDQIRRLKVSKTV